MLSAMLAPSFTRHPRVRATLHLLHFGCWFALSIAAWDHVGPTWAQLYRDSLSAPWRVAEGPIFVLAQPHADPSNPHQDTLIRVANRAHLDRPRTAVVSFLVSSRYTGYVDLSFLLALLIATPMSLGRRAVVIPLGLVLAHTLVVLRVCVAVMHQAYGQPALELSPLPGALAWLIQTTYEGYVADNLEAGLLTDLLIWAVLAFPIAAWSSFLAGATPAPDAAPSAPTGSTG